VKISKLTWALLLAGFTVYAHARTYTFDPAMLGAAGKSVDMSLLDQGGQLPGTYPVDILLNGEHVDSREVEFRTGKDASGNPALTPCLSVKTLNLYGVKTENYANLSSPQAGLSKDCANLNAIPDATATFHLNMQQLILSIPQVAMRPKEDGIAPQESWDDGIPAFLMNYNMNTSRTDYKNGIGSHSDSSYIQLNPGMNLGPWRLRSANNWQKNGIESGHWQRNYIYAERGINSIKSRLTIGERTTSSAVFESIPFRGMMMASDEDMVPYNQRQFAPVVRGVARTQARIEVRQNGYLIYNKTVSPGPFALTDLSVPSDGGNLDVTIWEADGQTRRFTVPYQTPAIALKEGYFKYNVMAGKYRPADNHIQEANVAMATMMYGLPWNLTLFGGGETAEHYSALSAGVGASLGDAGSISVDGISAKGQRYNHIAENGSTWRLRYSNEIHTTGTTFSLATYQHASAGYNTLDDVLSSYRTINNNSANDWRSSKQWKSRNSLTLGQSWDEYGNISASAARTNYRNNAGSEQSFSLSYGVTVDDVSLSLAWTKNKGLNLPTDTITSLWVNVPLGRWLGNNTNATYQLVSPSNGNDAHEVGLNGRAYDNQLSWNVRQKYRSGVNADERMGSSLRMDWYGGYGQVGGSYNYSQAMRQMEGDLSGGMIISRDGLTLGQPLSNTIALIEAPGATGVPVNGWPGVRTDFRGYTTLSSLNPYQDNTVSLDPTDLPDDAELTQTDVRVVPTKGAVIPATFMPRIGAKALMTVTLANGKNLPFGTPVMLEDQGSSAGLADTSGKVYLTGLPEKGSLLAKWGQEQCRIRYQLPEQKGPAGIYQLRGTCV